LGRLRAREASKGAALGLIVLGFVVVIIFVIALGWLAIVSRPK
jgi:hypothetical protein